MKKILSIILSIVTLLSLLAFAGCSDKTQNDSPIEVIVVNNKKYEKVALSKDNYSQYLCFNVSITDVVIDKTDDEAYNIYLIAEFSTSSYGDYLFNDGLMSYSIKIYNDETGWKWNIKETGFIQIDFNGKSSSSFSVKKENSPTVEILHLGYSRIEVGMVSGSVLVPKE